MTAVRCLVASVVLWVLAPTPAHATNVEVCIQITTAWTDLDGGDDWTTDDDRIARGIWLIVKEVGGSNVFNNLVSESTGCATVAVTLGHSYEVSNLSAAVVNGVSIGVYDNEASPNSITYWHHTSQIPWVPDTADSKTFFLLPTVDWPSQLLVAMKIFDRNDFGLASPNNFVFFYDTDDVDDGDGGGATDDDCCYVSRTDGFVRANTSSRFIIAHEIGHAILMRRDENTASQFDYDFDPDTCDGESDVPADPTTGHSLTEAEYQAAALSEGWADFVANWAFNDPQYVDEDCEGIHWYASDFDLDGVLDNQDPLGVYDCDSTPMAGLEAWVSSADWLEDAVDTANDDLECDVSTAHKSTQLDGQRYFWDMHADWNVPVDHLVGILDLANPKDWDPDNNVAGSGGCNTGSVGCTATDDDPIVRLELGADTHPADYAEEHDSCKVNGQDH